MTIIDFFAYIYNIFKSVSIGSTHVDPIAIMSVYAGVDYIRYILLTVSYIYTMSAI